MNSHPYTLFNKSLEQVRLLGARGRTFGRNQRVRRRALVAMPPPRRIPAIRIPVAESVAMLDARFPWLRGAEKRGS